MRGVTRYPVHLFVIAWIQNTILATEPLCRSSLLNGESIHIPDRAFDASSFLVPTDARDDFSTARARMKVGLDTDNITPWKAEILNEEQYVQVDLGTPSLIKGLQTTGCGSNTLSFCDEFVTQYRVRHSLDGNIWLTVREAEVEKVFKGNSDPVRPVYNELDCPIIARFVRINPVEWHNWITLKFDVLGCYIPKGSSSGVSADLLHQVPAQSGPNANTGALPASSLTISANKKPSAHEDCIGGRGKLSCFGKPDGDYQHCVSCKKFIHCSENYLTEFACHSSLIWDNNIKNCTTTSSTCR